MDDAYIGEIRIFSGNYAPKGWAFCDGSLLQISTHTALYSILRTRYGGDGISTFALPDLTGRAPMGKGEGPGLTPRSIGDKAGESTHTLRVSEMPAHTHAAKGYNETGGNSDPSNQYWAQAPRGRSTPPLPIYESQPTVAMSPRAISFEGQSYPHNNMQPYLVMNYIICLEGEFPQHP